MGACLFSASLAWGTNVTNVSIGDNFFSPKNVTISVNDQVKWTWAGNAQHTSTSDTGLWNAGPHGKGGTFSKTFTSAGTFPYHCNIHFGQVGAITVQAAALTPPTVAIVSPTNGTVLLAPADFAITASANAPGGNVTQVQFFQDGTALGIASSAPFLQTVTGLAAGNYTFSAVATDNTGAKATNAVSLTVVAPAPVRLSLPRHIPGAFEFDYSATAGASYVVLRSSDLANWTALSTNRAGASVVTFSDNSALAGPAYYRVGQLPNP